MLTPHRYMLYIDEQYSGSVYDYGNHNGIKPTWISVKYTDTEPLKADTVEGAKAALVAVAAIAKAFNK